MAYEPLTVTSFSDLLRKNPPPGKDFTYTTTDAIMNWAENNEAYQTYFKPNIKNLPPGNKFHNPNEAVGTMMPNPVYVTDYPEYKASLDPDHLKYLGHNVEQMFSDLGTGIAGGLGWMEDPDGMAKFRTNALEIMADKTKWIGVTGLYMKGLANLSKGMELDKDTPEYREGKRQAKEWYGISQAYLKTGEHMAAERMANSTALRGYFRWMDDQPMTVENMFHAEQFKRSMAEMLPSVLAMTGATAVTGGGALVAGATMLALEGSGEWSEAIRILTEEGIPVKDEKGNVLMEPRFITTEIEGKSTQMENPKFGQPLRETMSFEEAAPIAGQAALIYGAISAPLETFQIGRATRLLKIAPQARRSFILKILDKAVKKAPLTTRGAAWVTDFALEGVEGASIEWLQTVTQMTANKAIEEGYGNNPKEALEALAHELGPMKMTPFMFSEEGGMSDEAKTSFLLGFTGEVGFGTIGGPGRMAYERITRKGPKHIRTETYAEYEDTVEGQPPAPPVLTDGDQALALVQAPDKTGSAVGYANMLVSQATEGTPFYANTVNLLISKAGGAGDDDINKLIDRDTRQETDIRPDRKAFNLLKELEDDPEARKKVLDIINESPILKAGIVAIDKNIVKDKLSQKDQGTATAPSPSEAAIDEMDTDEWVENMDNIEELVNAKLEEQGLAKLQAKAEKKYEAEVDDDEGPIVSSDAEDIAAGKAMGLQGTDAQILTQYKKELVKSEKAPVKKVKKVTPTKNINKESAPLQHLQSIQQQSGDAGVRAILKGNKKKKIPQASLTTLNVLQNELFQEADRLPVNTQNREAVVEKIAHKIFSLAPTTPQVAPHKRKAPVKKKPVKTITKKKPITVDEVIPDTGEITVFRDKEKSTIKVDEATDNVAGAIQVKLTGLDMSDPTDKSTPIKDADTLIVPGDQAGLIKQMQQMNVPGADKITVSKDGKVDYVEADGFIKEFFKDSFKHIRYNNKQLPQKGVEFFDLSDGKSYSVSPDIAKAYGDQRKGRDQKKVAVKPDAEDIAMAKSMDISVEDYMKTIAASEKGTPAQRQLVVNEEISKQIGSLVAEGKIDLEDLAIAVADMTTEEQEQIRDEIRELNPTKAAQFTPYTPDLPSKQEIEAADYKVMQALFKGAPAKKKTKEPLAAEKADKLIDDIIGAPEVSSKTKSKVKTIAKEAQTKQDAAAKKTEEIDSTTDDVNDKLDEDLCI